jgi:hypothetical protein
LGNGIAAGSAAVEEHPALSYRCEGGMPIFRQLAPLLQAKQQVVPFSTTREMPVETHYLDRRCHQPFDRLLHGAFASRQRCELQGVSL